MENRLQMRISRMFRSSFGSCRTRNFSDVMEKAVFAQHNPPSFQLVEPMSPKVRPFPSILRPKEFETSETLHAPCKDSLCGRPCLPASPVFGVSEKVKNSPRSKKNTRRKKKNNNNNNKHRETTPFGCCTKDTNFGGNWWYSSDDDETKTLFSSKSTSSDSSRSRRRRRRSSRKKPDGSLMGSKTGNSKMGVMPLQGNKVKDTFAVVKRSSDPYNDFRTSMVEMIIEKQIFAARDLENLLHCFLSLNSYHHHKVIVEVFTEIYDALFSDWF